MNQDILNLYMTEYQRRDKAKKVVWKIGLSITSALFLLFAFFALGDWIDGEIDNVEMWSVVPVMFILAMMVVATWLISLLVAQTNKQALADLQTAYPDPQGIAWQTYKSMNGSGVTFAPEAVTQDAVEAARARVASRNS